jgi:hypothetical protein
LSGIVGEDQQTLQRCNLFGRQADQRHLFTSFSCSKKGNVIFVKELLSNYLVV